MLNTTRALIALLAMRCLPCIAASALQEDEQCDSSRNHTGRSSIGQAQIQTLTYTSEASLEDDQAPLTCAKSDTQVWTQNLGKVPSSCTKSLLCNGAHGYVWGKTEACLNKCANTPHCNTVSRYGYPDTQDGHCYLYHCPSIDDPASLSWIAQVNWGAQGNQARTHFLSAKCTDNTPKKCATRVETVGCSSWGDPHWAKTFAGKNRFDFMGLGVYQLAKSNDGSFELQTYQCRSKPQTSNAITAAIAIKIDGKVVIIKGDSVTNHNNYGKVWEAPPNAKVYSKNPFIELYTFKGDVPSWSIGYAMTMSLEVESSIVSSDGICAEGTGTDPVACEDALFNAEELAELCHMCGMENCETCPTTPDDYEPEDKPEDTCEHAGISYQEAEEACEALTETPEFFKACILDFCSSGGDEEVVKEAEKEEEVDEEDDTPDAPTTTITTTECTEGTCKVWGDPHISVFDTKVVSLISSLTGFVDDSDAREDRNNNFKTGDFWLVKSHDVHIQARYNLVKERRNKPFLKGVAVGGPFLRGNVLLIGPKQGQVFWNKQAITPSLKEAPFKVDGLVNVTSRKDAPLVQDTSLTQEGLEITLPLGVRMLANRYPDILSVSITSGRLAGQEGECGNFNGDASDDTEEQIKARGARVLVDEVLFHEQFNPFREQMRDFKSTSEYKSAQTA